MHLLSNCRPARNLSLILALLCFPDLSASETGIVYLSGTGNDHTKTWDFYVTGGRNSGTWTTIEVPSCWEQQGFGEYNYGHDRERLNEQGLYRTYFKTPQAWKDKCISIVFEGVMTDAEVSINGQPAGPVHQGGFYRFQYDLCDKDLLKFSDTDSNLLEVTVSKHSANEFVNAAERKADYWIFGGIYRPVYLTIKPENHIRRLAINARADGTFNMDVFCNINRRNLMLAAQIEKLDGTPVGSEFRMPALKETDRSGMYVKIKHPELWSPEFPNLYRVRVELRDRSTTLHTVTERFGFRTVEVRKQDGIYVNGARVVFKGVNRHTFWPESGRTTSKTLSIKDVLLMKEMNMNAVRMSHYPPDVHFLDACDSLGLFVLDELAGWQQPPYDTETGKKLVMEMVTRDVNHPSIILWDNGNEGGWNRELDAEFGKWDIQKRHVIHPWEVFDGTDTQHYKPYYYGNGSLYQGKEIFFPTEFLHGLYDGGHGAGLEDHWKLMMGNPLSAGMFLWCLVDEGLARTDKEGWIDTDGNHAPDGILGPYREKEGSFYTIKEIWSPVYIPMQHLPAGFNGRLPLHNRYMFTDLSRCRFTRTLAQFNPPLLPRDKKYYSTDTRELPGPGIPPAEKGFLNLQLPSDWQKYHVLYLTATDPHGNELFTWSWPLKSTLAYAESTEKIKTAVYPVRFTEQEESLDIEVYNLSLQFSKQNGRLTKVVRKDTLIPLTNGPRFFSTHTPAVTSVDHFLRDNSYIIRVNHENEKTWFRWTVRPDGLLKLEYQYYLRGEFDFAGVGFDFPESRIEGARVLCEGPYRVWKNRLKGTRLDIWDKPYNNTVTGESWEYPEFKGYYADPYWVWIENDAMPFLMVSGSENSYLHLFTPDPPAGAYNDHNSPAFPDAGISIMHGITPIGTKFRKASEHGPQGQKNIFEPVRTMPVAKSGVLYFHFGRLLD